MITSVLAIVLVLVIILAIFVFGGFGNSYESNTNTVYLLEDGKVISNSVEIFDENTYSKDDLKAYIKEAVDTYNAENEKAVKQKSLNVKDGKAILVMEYATAEDFESFEGTEVFVGSIAEAVKAGYTFETDFANVSGGKIKAGSSDEFMNSADYQVMIVKANVNVCLEEKEICFVSAENTESVKDGVVVIKDGANLLANVAVEEIEGTEAGTEVGTEIEGAITDEELLLESEEEIIFDFGDEEVEENQYSSVYTYIIYK
jgi:flagellar basal body-associated protein FliL